MGLRSLDDGYVPPILDVSKLDRKVLVSNEESIARRARAARQGGHLRRRLRRRGRARRAQARGRARGGRRRLRARRRRLEVPERRLLGEPTTSRRRWNARCGGSPARRCASETRRACAGGGYRTRRAASSSSTATASPRLRARHERRRVAVPLRARGRPGRAGRPRRRPSYELAVVHSHLSSPPRPSRTDVENIGLWEGKPYLIYSLREDDSRRLDDPGRRDRAARLTERSVGTCLRLAVRSPERALHAGGGMGVALVRVRCLA